MTIVKNKPRRNARESVLKALYAYNCLDENPKNVLRKTLDFFSKVKNNDIFYIETLFNSVLINCEMADKIIKKNLKNWEFGRIAQLDKILLRMGICEIFFIDDVPPKASISEMVEISKIYSTEESPIFINGILDSVYKDYKKRNKSL